MQDTRHEIGEVLVESKADGADSFDAPLPPPLFDWKAFDLSVAQMDRQAIMAVNRHRGASLLLDRIVYLSDDRQRAIALSHVQPGAWWQVGHVAGQGAFPPALMIEAAAQIASIMFLLAPGVPDYEFVGFASLDQTRFFDVPRVGEDLVIVARMHRFNIKGTVCDMQGYASDRLLFEARIKGLPFSPRGGPRAKAIGAPPTT